VVNPDVENFTSLLFNEVELMETVEILLLLIQPKEKTQSLLFNEVELMETRRLGNVFCRARFEYTVTSIQ
jgi:hypothetical protein